MTLNDFESSTMAFLLKLSHILSLVLVIGLAASQPTTLPANVAPETEKSAIVFQQDGDTPQTNPAAQKKVTVGDPESTMTTMTGGGQGYQIHDIVKKVMPKQPDSNRVINSHYKKSVNMVEDLKTPSKGTKKGHLMLDKDVETNEVRNIVHKDGRAVTDTESHNHKHVTLGMHRMLDETDRNVHTNVYDSCETCGKISHNLNEGKDSALEKSSEDNGDMTTHYSETDSEVHNKNQTGHSNDVQMWIKHKNQQKTGTVQTVKDGKNDLMIGAMHDTHTELIQGQHDSKHAHNEKETPNGKVTEQSAFQKESISAADIREHITNAYHDTPLHKFYMNNKQTRDDRFHTETSEDNYDTEVKGKDGVKTKAHVEKRTNIDASQLQHVDELNIKAMPKAHPEQVTRVQLRSRILDRDHLTMNQHKLRNTVTEMPDGGKRTMSVREDTVTVKNLKTTPTDKHHVDTLLPISEQVHQAEKNVVPADKELETPLQHHYHIRKIK